MNIVSHHHHSLQESGTAGPRLRPRQRHVREGLPHAHAWLERRKYVPAAQPLLAVLVVKATAIAGRVEATRTSAATTLSWSRRT